MNRYSEIKLREFDKANQHSITIGGLDLYFSYETCVGFNSDLIEEGDVISENIWSNTTGKFLNMLEGDHKKRFPHDKFTDMLSNVLELHGFNLKSYASQKDKVNWILKSPLFKDLPEDIQKVMVAFVAAESI